MNKSPIEYACCCCDTMMRKFQAAELPPKGMFTYHQGVFLSGMMSLFKMVNDEKYLKYVTDWVDSVTTDDNKIICDKTGWVSLETLDFRQPGIVLYKLYEQTNEEKYKECLKYLAKTLKNFPTNSDGGFWHMVSQKNQMWLDGLYMAGPLMTMYALLSGETEFFDIAARQIDVMYKHMYDEKSGLMFHGYDESKKAVWANAKTGCSSEIWGRAMGWYVTAIADMLDYIPQSHPMYVRIVEIESSLLKSIIKYQDITGRWYQVVNRIGEVGNWLENSASCLFVYSISKCVRKGILPPEYKDYADKGYNGIINSLKFENDDMILDDICVGTCIDEGDFKHYSEREKCQNDLHGTGAFVLMSTEYSKI